MNKIITIVGPTGVGKTRLSIELAKHYNLEVINADSMQIYKRLNIGTAKVTKAEKKGVRHHLIDVVNPDYFYTVSDYQKDGRRVLNNLKNKAVVVGGTGLYIKSLLFDYRFADESDISETYENYTNQELYDLAIKKDPNMDIHINNRQRLVRFLNKELTDYIGKDKLLYDTVFIGLTTDRDTLNKRIEDRVDIMVHDGLINEVETLYNENIRSKAIMTGIGYKELYSYFDKEISLDDAIEEIKHSSKKYTKRQYTWFKNQMDINWFDVDFNNFAKTIEEIINFIDSL